ncbi:MAG: class I SAM-dependent methyltransferase [Rhodomicrobium sp.]
MFSDAARHYDSLLAEHYTWMFGVPFAEKAAEQQTILERLGVGASARRLAIDLGCGSGFQSIALADLGFERVLAIDTSATLLAELRRHAEERPIEAVEADLSDLSLLVSPGGADAIVCMGDTLTHLDSTADVICLFRNAHQALVPGGLFILSFRNLSTALTGLDRFIPIRADDDRVMTCFLEYEPETVVVHDLIHVRDGMGWSLRKSSYRKLRLAPTQAEAELKKAGFEVQHSETSGGLWIVAAAKRDAVM